MRIEDEEGLGIKVSSHSAQGNKFGLVKLLVRALGH
jgi:hypothetical protein